MGGQAQFGGSVCVRESSSLLDGTEYRKRKIFETKL